MIPPFRFVANEKGSGNAPVPSRNLPSLSHLTSIPALSWHRSMARDARGCCSIAVTLLHPHYQRCPRRFLFGTRLRRNGGRRCKQQHRLDTFGL